MCLLSSSQIYFFLIKFILSSIRTLTAECVQFTVGWSLLDAIPWMSPLLIFCMIMSVSCSPYGDRFLLGGGRSHSTGPFFCFTQDNEKSDIAVEEFMLHCFAESDLWKPLHMAQWWNSIACVNLLIWFDVFFSAQRMEFLLNREILLNINVAHYFSVLWWFCDTKLLQIRGVTLKPKYATTLLFRGGNNW